MAPKTSYDYQVGLNLLSIELYFYPKLGHVVIKNFQTPN